MRAFLLPAVGARAWRRMGLRSTSPAPATVRSPPSLAEEIGGQRQFAATKSSSSRGDETHYERTRKGFRSV